MISSKRVSQSCRSVKHPFVPISMRDPRALPILDRIKYPTRCLHVCLLADFLVRRRLNGRSHQSYCLWQIRAFTRHIVKLLLTHSGSSQAPCARSALRAPVSALSSIGERIKHPQQLTRTGARIMQGTHCTQATQGERTVRFTVHFLVRSSVIPPCFCSWRQ